ncbi:MAG TPA: 2-dehydropantoate 2-reductase N-terminal domain-containing protein, partial [Armatimonadota bacterium]|nr:2-dehydropantoate 2-reductase N-terminal domain-containing protein [Armatimonadota bacterium]
MTSPAAYAGSRLAVIGPGALGTLFAARLALAGVPTLLLDYRTDRALALNERGIRLITRDGETLVPAPVTADPRNLAQVDAALVLVKAYQTEQAALTLAEHLPPQGIAITLSIELALAADIVIAAE